MKQTVLVITTTVTSQNDTTLHAWRYMQTLAKNLREKLCAKNKAWSQDMYM